MGKTKRQHIHQDSAGGTWFSLGEKPHRDTSESSVYTGVDAAWHSQEWPDWLILQKHLAVVDLRKTSNELKNEWEEKKNLHPYKIFTQNLN